ncbi:hypothetical protein GW915_04335 [bacterium]|nr:hypothetical protein [bacterium]
MSRLSVISSFVFAFGILLSGIAKAERVDSLTDGPVNCILYDVNRGCAIECTKKDAAAALPDEGKSFDHKFGKIKSKKVGDRFCYLLNGFHCGAMSCLDANAKESASP